MFTKKEAPKNETKKSTEKEGCGCSAPATKNPSTPAKFETEYSSYDSKKNAQKKTKVTIKYDVGFQNQLYIRGKGANLTWDKGIPLKNVKSDEWVWETDTNFSTCEFKVLLNDKQYEQGDNHYLTFGSAIVYTPRF